MAVRRSAPTSGPTTRVVQLEPLTLRAAVRSVDPERRTVDLIITTGARVMRFGWDGSYQEELGLGKKNVRMKRLNNGAPLLNAHGGLFGPMLEDVVGVVESAQLEEDKQIVGTVRFARAEDDPKADQAFRKVADGIVRNVSVGYRVYRLEKVEEVKGQPPVMRATDWEPYEVSLVPMGADDGAKVRGESAAAANPCLIVAGLATRKEKLMDPQNESEFIAERDQLRADPPAGDPPPQPEPNERDTGVAQERERTAGILQAVRAARLPQSVADRLLNSGKPLVECQREVFAELSRRDVDVPRSGARGPQVEVVGDDPLVHERAGITNAILHRVRPKTGGDPHGFELDERGRIYRGMTLLRVAEAFLNGRGIRTTGLSKMQLAAVALGLDQVRGPGMHTTSDFPLLLADVANKTLRQAYNEAPATWLPISRRTTLPDFKPVKRLQLGEAPALLEVGEHGEFTFGTIGEGKEQFQLASYGRRFAITRKALVNDDTDAFGRVPTAFGRSARNLESDLVWLQITSNPAMGDTVALFHASHGNLAGAGAVISVTTVGAGRAAMRVQKGIDGVTLLNVFPRYLLVPAAQETVADQFVSTALLAQQQSNVNPFAGRLSVIPEPRLDANSTTAWYLAADPGQIDVIEYAYLEGEEGPQVESRLGWEVDGLEIKCREDFAAKVIDHRGLYKNPGA